jgi:hypothetical protein
MTGNDVLFEQLLISVQLARRIPVGRPRALKGGADTVDFRLIGRGIERRDNVALLDLVAGLDAALHHPTADPEGKRGLMCRSCLSRYRTPPDHVGIDDAERNHGPWRRCSLHRNLVTACADQK